MTRFLRLILVFIALLPAQSMANEPPYMGIWKGTIGKHNVQVCFTEFDANYYYLSKKHAIRLVLDEKDKTKFNEEISRNDNQTTWTLTSYNQKQMLGNWLNSKTQEHLDIKLNFIDKNKDGYSCNQDFYAPLHVVIKTNSSKDAEEFQKKYPDKVSRMVTNESGEAFFANDSVKNATKLNRFITDWLKAQTISAYDCEANGGGGYSRELRPIYWDDNWIVMSDSMPDTYCGGAHGNFDFNSITYNLDKNKIIDTWSWIKNKNDLTKNNRDKPKSTLRQMIEKLHPRDDCKEYFDGMYISAPYPTKDGLVFPTSFFHAMRACGDDVFIPYEKIKKHLTAQGKLAVQNIQSK